MRQCHWHWKSTQSRHNVVAVVVSRLGDRQKLCMLGNASRVKLPRIHHDLTTTLSVMIMNRVAIEASRAEGRLSALQITFCLPDI